MDSSLAGTLTSRVMPLMMPCLQHLVESKHALRPGGPTMVWASMRDESAAVAELSRWRNLWKLSSNCMPAIEFLNRKILLTKILLTHTTNLNTVFQVNSCNYANAHESTYRKTIFYSCLCKMPVLVSQTKIPRMYFQVWFLWDRCLSCCWQILCAVQ